MSPDAADALRAIRDETALTPDQDAKLTKAMEELNHAFGSGKLVAEGRPRKDRWEPLVSHRTYKPIPFSFFDGLRAVSLYNLFRIDFMVLPTCWTDDPGPFYYDVRVFISDVQRLWPADVSAQVAELNAISVAPTLYPVVTARPRGRPPKWDWKAMFAYVVRIANTPDGLPATRSELQEQVMKWFLDQYGDTPAESEVRKQLQQFYPR